MEENKKIEEKYLNLSFFKKLWYSITKFERYPELAAIGVKKAVLYFIEIVLIFSLLYTGIYIKSIDKNIDENDQNLELSEKIIKSFSNTDEQIKDSYIEYLNSMQEGSVTNIIMLVSLFVSIFIQFTIVFLIDILMLSLLGLITCMITGIKMNYKAVFNMSIYALTLPIIFRIVYLGITMLTSFEIKYFEIMYRAISYIYLATAILLIKSNVIKQHLELMKIIEENKGKIEEKITNQNKPKEKNETKEEKEPKENKEEKETGEQGSNA